MNIWSVDHRSDKAEMTRIVNSIREESDLYILASFVMRALGINNSVSGLFNLLNSEDFLNLIKVYGGKTVHVPTLDDLIESFKFIKLLYCYDFQGESFSRAMEHAGFPKRERDMLLKKRDTVLKKLKELYPEEM